MEPLHHRAGPTRPTTSAWKAGAQRPRPLHQEVWVLGCPPNGSLRLGARGLSRSSCVDSGSVRPPSCKRTALAGETAILAEGKFVAAVSGKARSHKSVSSIQPLPPTGPRPREGRREEGQTSRSGRCGGISQSLIRIHYPSC